MATASTPQAAASETTTECDATERVGSEVDGSASEHVTADAETGQVQVTGASGAEIVMDGGELLSLAAVLDDAATYAVFGEEAGVTYLSSRGDEIDATATVTDDSGGETRPS